MTWTRHDETTPDDALLEEAVAASQRTRRAFLAGAGGVLAGAMLVVGERSRAGATEAGLLGAGTGIPAGATPSTPPTPGGLSRKSLGRGTVTRGGTIKVPEGKDMVVDTVSIAPGAEAGWHTHPGDELIMVTAGTLTFLRQDGATCVTEELKAGQAFLGAAAGQVHTAFNSGSAPVDAVVAFFGVPVGEPPRVDAEKPLGLNCG
ncbi:MAG: cupin domain-containing protein [Acidimicrobiia bacterium]